MTILSTELMQEIHLQETTRLKLIIDRAEERIERQLEYIAELQEILDAAQIEYKQPQDFTIYDQLNTRTAL